MATAEEPSPEAEIEIRDALKPTDAADAADAAVPQPEPGSEEAAPSADPADGADPVDAVHAEVEAVEAEVEVEPVDAEVEVEESPETAAAPEPAAEAAAGEPGSNGEVPAVEVAGQRPGSLPGWWTDAYPQVSDVATATAYLDTLGGAMSRRQEEGRWVLWTGEQALFEADTTEELDGFVLGFALSQLIAERFGPISQARRRSG